MERDGSNDERRTLARFEHWLKGLSRTGLQAAEKGREAPSGDLIERLVGSLDRGFVNGRAFVRHSDRDQPNPIGPLMITLGKEGAVTAGALLPLSGPEDRDGFHGAPTRFRRGTF